MIIGIGGVSRAGKTTLANLIKDHLKGKTITILNQDDFVKKSNLPKIKNRIDWEHPASLDWTSLKSAIQKAELKYSIVIVEGLFAFYNPSISKLYDKSLFVTIENNLFVERKRKDKRWGFEPEWFIKHIWQSFLKFGNHTFLKQEALIINGSKKINMKPIIRYIAQ